MSVSRFWLSVNRILAAAVVLCLLLKDKAVKVMAAVGGCVLLMQAVTLGTLFLNGGLRRQKPDYYYLGSKRQFCLWDNVRTGDNLCLWLEVCGLVYIQTHCGCQVAGWRSS